MPPSVFRTIGSSLVFEPTHRSAGAVEPPGCNFDHTRGFDGVELDTSTWTAAQPITIVGP